MFRYFLARDIYNMGERRIYIKEKKKTGLTICRCSCHESCWCLLGRKKFKITSSKSAQGLEALLKCICAPRAFRAQASLLLKQQKRRVASE